MRWQGAGVTGPLSLLVWTVSACGGDGPTPPIAVASISLFPADTTIDVEGSFSFRAVANAANGEAIAGVTLAFAAQTAGIVDLSTTGQVVGASTGVTVVSASASGITATAILRVRARILIYEMPPLRTFAEVYDVDNAGSVVGALYGRGIPEPFVSGTGTQLTLLPTLGVDVPAQARAISPAGVIVGYSYAADQRSLRLVTWTKAGVITDLGQVGIQRSIGLGFSAAGDILVNADRDPGTGPVEGGTLRAPDGVLTPIPALTGGSAYLFPTGVASSGAVVGLSVNAQSGLVPVIWHPAGGTQEIGGAPTDAYPAAVASGDRVVGWYDSADPKAFSWSPAGGFRSLPGLGGANSLAHDVKDLGTIVGAATSGDGYYHAVTWTGTGLPTDIGTALPGPSAAWAISPSGIIAGLLFPSSNPVPGTQLSPNRVFVLISNRRN